MIKKKVGLALGGGFARGFAHIGVIQVLQKHKIPIDVVAGCSIGSIIGGIYASGCEIQYLASFVQSVEGRQLFDYTIPTQGYIKGNKIQQLIKILTRGYRFEQTKLPFACIAVDIESGELKTFRKGYLYEAIRASISIPGIFRPYEIGGRTYVDGGVIDRLAVDAAREIGGDFIISADVGYRGGGLAKPARLSQVVESAFTIAGWELTKEQRKRADFLLDIDVNDFNPNVLKDADKIIERGVIATENYMPEILQKLKDAGIQTGNDSHKNV